MAYEVSLYLKLSQMVGTAPASFWDCHINIDFCDNGSDTGLSDITLQIKLTSDSRRSSRTQKINGFNFECNTLRKAQGINRFSRDRRIELIDRLRYQRRRGHPLAMTNRSEKLSLESTICPRGRPKKAQTES